MVKFAANHPRLVTAVMLVLTIAAGAFVVRVETDTDPENMLSPDDPARVTHNELKGRFNIYDMIVVGVVNDESDHGVFNPRSLRKIHELTEFALTLHGEALERPAGVSTGARQVAGAGKPSAPVVPEVEPRAEPAVPAIDSQADENDPEGPALPPLPVLGSGTEDEAGAGTLPPLPGAGAEEKPSPPGGERASLARQDDGVVALEVLSLSTVDRIFHDAEHSRMDFAWLMHPPLPRTQQEASEVRKWALDNPLLRDTIVSADGKAAAIYLPITHKELSYKISQRLREKIEELGGPEQYHITGLPVAEDTFGHEMFVQMAVSAPLAMLVIFILMFGFFRNVTMIVSPMIIALVSVVVTMGALIGSGYTVHIMSSMIPIFIMPIAVLDAIHILSDFFDRYQATRDRRATCLAVMDDLFVPMLYTSLTSAAGFASLALTPIPPVQVFGVFVALGIMLAWVLTVTFCPAYIMLIPERRLANFGVAAPQQAPSSHLARLLHATGDFTRRRGKPILACTLALAAVALYGISRIRINDNPTKWFTRNHPIRLADRTLNAHFGGTYQAYLALVPASSERSVRDAAEAVKKELAAAAQRYSDRYGPSRVFETAARAVESGAASWMGREGAVAQFLDDVLDDFRELRDTAGDPFAWEDAVSVVEVEGARLAQPFKQPENIRFIQQLQGALSEIGADGARLVGKSNSLADVVMKVNRELHGTPEAERVPPTVQGVADCILQYQGTHRPNDLWHFVTPDYGSANVWLQLKSGDNKDMEEVIAATERFMADHPGMEHRWFGLTYINVAWQRKMVTGMLQAFLGSFVVVFILMTVLFHSALWGLLCMIPLSVTILAIYGLIGLVGKDYDMPVAVLSSLALGLAVDFAIHFLARSRALVREAGSWADAAKQVFGEPARAISRNAIVVAVGFLPLLAAPLMPYKTVGVLMACILALAAASTLVILPALVTAFQKRLFAASALVALTCNCISCVAVSIAVVVLLALSFQSYFRLGWNQLSVACALAIPILVFLCGFASRRRECRRLSSHQDQRAEPVGTDTEKREDQP